MSRKITVVLPDDLVLYADQVARRARISRSQVISQALARIREEDADRLAAEGYQFYSREASEFAQVSARAVAETFEETREWEDIFYGEAR